ncbi:MAG: hypothetical protein E7434_02585 [Ruminococcaceae bacterium]|nr:hypothetical protein [Oscillospiraceae bacterium]
MSFEEMRACRKKVSAAMDATLSNFDVLAAESERVADVLHNAEATLNEYDCAFEEKTKLTKTDIVFLFTAVGLQVLRQYLLTNFKERLDDQAEAEKHKKDKDHSNRHHRYYNPSIDEIKSNPVPFDALNGANGALRGGGVFKHRGSTLGHDPILGLVFGTANIATSTLTTKTLQSYHIITKNKKDYFHSRASTVKVFEKTADKLLHEGVEGWEKVGRSLLKEIQHLISDVNSKDSLPLPFLSLIDGIFDTSFASDLAKYGIDMANVITVGKQAAYAILINSIIAMIHRLLYKGSTDEDLRLYEVRTRKILMYSNAIAAASNVAVVALTNDFKKLDIGGIGVAIYRLITDTKFIYEVKRDFVFGHFDKLIEGERLKLKIVDSDFNIIEDERMN